MFKNCKKKKMTFENLEFMHVNHQDCSHWFVWNYLCMICFVHMFAESLLNNRSSPFNYESYMKSTQLSSHSKRVMEWLFFQRIIQIWASANNVCSHSKNSAMCPNHIFSITFHFTLNLEWLTYCDTDSTCL